MASGDPSTSHFSLRTGKVLLHPTLKRIIKVRMDTCSESTPVATSFVGKFTKLTKTLSKQLSRVYHKLNNY